MDKELVGQALPEGASGSVLMDIRDRECPWSLSWDQGCLFHILISALMEGTLSTFAGDTELRYRDTPEAWGHPQGPGQAPGSALGNLLRCNKTKC